MARTATLLDLRTRAKTRADMTGSAFLSDTEWHELINQSLAGYYDLLVNAQVAPVKTTTITGVDGTVSYALPADFYVVVNVARLDATGNVIAELERYDLANLATQMMTGDKDYPDYRVQGATFGSAAPALALAPSPTTGLIVQVTYVPVSPVLVADGDVMDGINGWEEYVVCDAAAKAVEKEEGDSRALLGRVAAAEARIQAQLPQRDQFKSQQIRDVTRGDLTGLPWRRP